MGLFDNIKDALGGKKTETAAEAADRAATQAEVDANEQAIVAATERAEAEERLKAEEQAIADAEKAVADKEAADKAAAEAEAQRVAEEQRAAEERAAADRAAAEQAAAAAAAPAPAGAPGVSLGHLLQVVEHDCRPEVATGDCADKGLGELIERALAKALADNNLPNANKMDGFLGTSFLEAYSVWQGHLGYDGDDANGYPGRESLQKLAEATGMFTVQD